jgi:choline-sulfatase
MSFTKPHSPYDPPEPYHRLYDPRELPRPLGADGDADGLEVREPTLTVSKHTHGFQMLPHETVQLARAHYYGMVTFQDECIGRVVSFLEEKGLRENTIIVYTGDHGDLLGDFEAFYKCSFLNGSVRIPSIWNCPACLPSGQRPQGLMGLQDVLPTLAALTDTPLSRAVDGMDLVPSLNGDSSTDREVYIGQCLGPGRQIYMACTPDYKYIYSEMNGVEELYDIRNDPHELRNAAKDHPERAAELKRVVVDWCRDNGDTDMLDGDDLVRTDADVEALCAFNANGMGWRYY